MRDFFRSSTGQYERKPAAVNELWRVTRLSFGGIPEVISPKAVLPPVIVSSEAVAISGVTLPAPGANDPTGSTTRVLRMQCNTPNLPRELLVHPAPIGRGGYATVHCAVDLQNPSSHFIFKMSTADIALYNEIHASRELSHGLVSGSWAAPVVALRAPPHMLQAMCANHQPELSGHMMLVLRPCAADAWEVMEALKPARASMSHEARAAVTIMLLREPARQLAHLHAQGIIHNDVSLRNILIQHGKHEPKAHLSDFGLSSALTDAGENASCGTPEYWPPEIYADDAARPSRDIYALALGGLETLIGQHIYTDANDLPGRTAAQRQVQNWSRSRDHQGWCEAKQKQAQAVHQGLGALLAACLDGDHPKRPSADEVDLRLSTLWSSLAASNRGMATQWLRTVRPKADAVEGHFAVLSNAARSMRSPNRSLSTRVRELVQAAHF